MKSKNKLKKQKQEGRTKLINKDKPSEKFESLRRRTGQADEKHFYVIWQCCH